MRIALIADVHANLPALETVLDDARRRGAQALWDLGDLTGYAPFPDQVVRAVHAHADEAIVGNYDLKVLDFPAKQETWRDSKAPLKFLAFQYAYEHLSEEARAILAALPAERRLRVENLTVLLVHGSPAENDEALRHDTPEQRLVELVELSRDDQGPADLILCGHSHDPFVRRVGETTFANPGSVGRPEGGDTRASYAMLGIVDREIAVELIRVDYDVDRTVQAVRDAHLPEPFSRIYLEGRRLEDVVDQQQRAALVAPAPSRERDEPLIDAALVLGRQCDFERAHAYQVTRLALRLFDDLAPLHGLDGDARATLHAASLLHDIGWLDGRAGHHKAAQRRILDDISLPLDDRRRAAVACVARYHRKALPDASHEVYGELHAQQQSLVSALAGLLRLADGLDRGHLARVRDVHCDIGPDAITVRCDVAGEVRAELEAARKKSDLLETALGRTLNVVMALPTPRRDAPRDESYEARTGEGGRRDRKEGAQC